MSEDVGILLMSTAQSGTRSVCNYFIPYKVFLRLGIPRKQPKLNVPSSHVAENSTWDIFWRTMYLSTLSFSLILFQEYGVNDSVIPCHYSRSNSSVAVTHVDLTRATRDLVLSVTIPLLICLSSAIILTILHARCCKKHSHYKKR